MSIQHHVPEETLVEYAAGVLGEGVALLVATHCALCPACRRTVEELEELGASAVDALDDAPLAAGSEDALLAMLDGPQPLSPHVPPPDGILPMPLRAYTGPLDEVPFKRFIPQVSQFDLPLTHGSMPVQLLKLRPGFRVPKHQHVGTERTLVLAGGFTDNYGQYGPGDLSVLGEGEDHLQRIDDGDVCIALVVNDSPLVPRTWVGKLARWLTGL